MDSDCLVVGHAMMPKGTATRDVHATLSMVARVERTTHEVLEASITLTTPVNRSWVEGLLVGERLLDQPSPFVERIERDYLGPAQRAIVQCYRDLARRYREDIEVTSQTGPTSPGGRDDSDRGADVGVGEP